MDKPVLPWVPLSDTTSSALDWSVEEWPITAVNGKHNLGCSTHKAIVRTHPDTVLLGVVGNAYTSIQNADLLAHTDTLAKHSDFAPHRYGLIDNGQLVFALLRYQKADPRFSWMPYLLVTNAHDGLRQFATSVLWVHEPQALVLSLSFPGAPNTHKVRHHGDTIDLEAEATRSLAHFEAHSTAFANRVLRMIEAPFPELIFMHTVEPLNRVSRNVFGAHMDRAQMRHHWLSSDAVPSSFRRTHFGAFWGVTSWLTHHRPERSARRHDAASLRFLSLWDGPLAHLIGRAFDLFALPLPEAESKPKKRSTRV